jgi:hypothetical protein
MNKNDELFDVGSIIKEALKKNNLSITNLAKELTIPASTISYWSRHKKVGVIINFLKLSNRLQLLKSLESQKIERDILNPFQKELVMWHRRQSEEKENFLKLKETSFLIETPMSYAFSMYESLIKSLKEEDSYFTVTNHKFWDTSFSQRFLQANYEASKKASIKRVFILPKNYLNDIRVKAILEDHKSVIERIQKEYGENRMVVKCYISEDVDSDMKRLGHFGVAVRHKKDKNQKIIEHSYDFCAAIIPKYHEFNMNGITFSFSSGDDIQIELQHYFSRFLSIFNSPQCQKLTELEL